MNPGASRLAVPRGNALGVARLQIKQIDLEEGVVLLPFTLKNQFAAISTEITLPGPFARKSQLPDRTQKATFVLRHILREDCCIQTQDEGNLEEESSHVVQT